MAKNSLQTRGTATGKKMAVLFAYIFMAKTKTRIIQPSNTKLRVWKRYNDNIFSLWDSNIQEVNHYTDQAYRLHLTIKFTAKVTENKITFLDTVLFKGKRFKSEFFLDIKTLQTN